MDIFIAIPLLWGLVRGLYKGIVMSVGSFLGLCLGVFLAYKYAPLFANVLTEWFTLSTQICYTLAYIFIFLIVALLTFLVAKILDKFLSIITLGWLNKLLGAVFGLLKYALIISVIVNLADYAGQYVKIIPQQCKENSIFYKPVKKLGPWVVPHISDIVQ